VYRGLGERGPRLAPRLRGRPVLAGRLGTGNTERRVVGVRRVVGWGTSPPLRVGVSRLPSALAFDLCTLYGFRASGSQRIVSGAWHSPVLVRDRRVHGGAAKASHRLPTAPGTAGPVNPPAQAPFPPHPRTVPVAFPWRVERGREFHGMGTESRTIFILFSDVTHLRPRCSPIRAPPSPSIQRPSPCPLPRRGRGFFATSHRRVQPSPARRERAG
jgi:hypothetical protein